MIFDKIIMNPPYSRNLHLKVLEKAIKYLKDDNSVCVNLSPIRWLQDPLAKYKKNSDYNKFEKSIAQHIESLDVIKAEDATGMFQALMHQNLGLYDLTKNGGFDYKFCKESAFIQKVKSFSLHWSDVVEKNKVDGIRVKCQKVRNSAPSSSSANLKAYVKGKDSYDLMYRTYSCIFINGEQNGKWWTEFGCKNKYTKPTGTPLINSIKFEDINSAKNFENSCWTDFMKYCNFISKVGVQVDFTFLPWLGEVENPRTHKIGYESDWTNEDLCKVFNITGFISDTEAEPESEWEEILETMKDFRGQRL